MKKKKKVLLSKEMRAMFAYAMVMTMAVPSSILDWSYVYAGENVDSTLTQWSDNKPYAIPDIPKPIQYLDFENEEIGVEKDAERGNVFHYTSDETELVLSNPYGDEELAKSLEERSEFDIQDETWKRYRGSRYQPIWEKGVTFSYWIKVPTDDNGQYKNSSVLRWELLNQEYYKADDYAKYLTCSFFDLEKTAKYLNYQEADYINAAKEESKVIYGSEYYFKYAQYAVDENGETIVDASGAPVAAMYVGAEGVAGPVYDARYFNETDGYERSSYYAYNPNFIRGYIKLTDGTYELQMQEIAGNTKNFYSQYSTLDINQGSMVRRANVNGELQIDADNSIFWVPDNNLGIQSNPNHTASYGMRDGMQNGDCFFMNSWRESSVFDENENGRYQSAEYVALSPVTSIQNYDEDDGTYTGIKNGNCNKWHQVTVTVQNDWVEFYVDGIKSDVDYNYSSKGKATIDNLKAFKRLNKGTGLRYGYGSEKGAADFVYGNYVCRLLMDWITDKEATLHIGGAGQYAAEYGLAAQSTEFYMDDLTFYGELLDEEQIKALYENAGKGIMGDANQDGMLGLDDPQQILMAALKLVELEDKVVTLADLDQNGVVQLSDALVALKELTGIQKNILNLDNVQMKEVEHVSSVSTSAVWNQTTQIVYTVSLKDGNDISIFDYGVVYDTDVLEMVSDSWESDFQISYVNNSGMLVEGITESQSHVVCAGISPTIMKWSGDILTMSFTVKDGKKVTDAEPFMLIPNASIYKGNFKGVEKLETTILTDVPQLVPSEPTVSETPSTSEPTVSETPTPSEPTVSEIPTPSEPTVSETPGIVYDSTKFQISEDGVLTKYIGTDTEVVIPKGVKKIDVDAFKYCLDVTGVVIPDSVSHIDNNAFYGCTALKCIDIPDSVIWIGDSAFEGCRNLVSVRLPEVSVGTWNIGSSVFKDCSSLETVVIPEGITSLDEEMFRGCSKLTSVKLPDSVVYIGNSAFRDCNSLTTIELPERLVCIGDFAFRDCSSLSGDLVLPKGITILGVGAFDGCSSLSGDLVIPEGVSTIEDSTFRGCSGLNGELTITGKVTLIGEWAFEDCSGLTGDVVIPEGVTTIERSAFAGCSGLTGMKLPSSVTHIGSEVFSECSNLTGSIEVPEGVIRIEWATFFGCSSLTDIILPKTVTYLGAGSFSGCKDLKNIDIPSGVSYIDTHAFSGCSSLTGVKIPEGIKSVTWGAFSGCSSLTSVELPETITQIASDAFYGCSSLTSIKIPESVTDIVESAFEDCSSLRDIEIPESVTWIGEFAFKGTLWLENKRTENPLVVVNHILIDGATWKDATVVIPDDVTTIGESAFYENDNLTSIIIPEGVTTIDWCAFEGCSNLNSIEIPKSVTGIDSSAFGDCNSLTTIKGYKGSYAETFANENAYIFVALSEGEQTPTEPGKDKAFYDVDGKEGITLPDAQMILKYALKITPSDTAYTLADAQMCLKIALKIVSLP